MAAASNNEEFCTDKFCDEQCIKAAAALECRVACAAASSQVPQSSKSCSTTPMTSKCCDTPKRVEQKASPDKCRRTSDDDEKNIEPASKECGSKGSSCCAVADDILLQNTRIASPSISEFKDESYNDDELMSEACSDHLNAAYKRYARYLKEARCICRAVLKKRLDVRCTNNDMSSRPEAFSTAKDMRGDLIKQRQLPCESLRKRKDPVRDGSSDCCAASGSKADKTCGVKNKDVIREVKDATCGADIRANEKDLESPPALEHVLLNVTGMDCPGCADNLTRSLNAVKGTSNARVTFVTGIAEFDADLAVVQVEEVVRYAQRATGYKLLHFTSDIQTLDLVMDAKMAKSFANNLPSGVSACDRLTSSVYEISYDPCVVGARDIMRSVPQGAVLAPPRVDKALSAGKKRLKDKLIKTILALALTIPVVVLAWAKTMVSGNSKEYVSIVLATVVQAIAVPEFYRPAMSALLVNRKLEMDMLVVISITFAYGYSVVAFGLRLAGRHVATKSFFETSSLLITFVLLGRLVAAYARARAISAVSTRSLQASTAILIDDDNAATEIDARLLQFGDQIRVQPYAQVVTDGDILDGSSEMDESMITGESLPVVKGVGSSVIAGTLNGPGPLIVRLKRLPGGNTITDITNLVQQAQAAKPRVQELADRLAGWFIPIVITLATVSAVIWGLVVARVRHGSTSAATRTAITYGIAVLAVSCPCALGLAVPMVLVIAGGIAARYGVVIKSAEATERGHKVTDVIFDKTGTLTEPNLTVMASSALNNPLMTKEDVWGLVLSVVKDDRHPVSTAIASHLKQCSSVSQQFRKSQTLPGAGLDGTWNGYKVRAGNPYWLQVDANPFVVDLLRSGMTLFCVLVDGHLVAVFGLQCSLRSEAKSVVQRLKARKINVHIVSGDHLSAVESVAEAFAIPSSNVAARRSPAEKQAYVRNLMKNGKVTLFCGDGTNDAAAAAQANVGVQLESTSDVTRATADVVLLCGLDGICTFLNISRAAFRRIIFNFVWAAIYNVFAISLAAGAFVRVRITPAYAGLGELVSILPVILIALTMPGLIKRGARV